MNEEARTEARAARRANHYTEARTALGSLTRAWRGDPEDPSYRAAVAYLKSVCRSCGEAVWKGGLCRDCSAAFSRKTPPRSAA